MPVNGQEKGPSESACMESEARTNPGAPALATTMASAATSRTAATKKPAGFMSGRLYLAIVGKKSLFQIFGIKPSDSVVGNLVKIVIEVGVNCSGYDQQFLVVAFELLEHIFAEIARMCFLSVH